MNTISVNYVIDYFAYSCNNELFAEASSFHGCPTWDETVKQITQFAYDNCHPYMEMIDYTITRKDQPNKPYYIRFRKNETGSVERVYTGFTEPKNIITNNNGISSGFDNSAAYSDLD